MTSLNITVEAFLNPSKGNPADLTVALLQILQQIADEEGEEWLWMDQRGMRFI